MTGAPGTSECATALQTILDVSSHLRFLIEIKKLKGLTPRLEFLGFVLDSKSMEVGLSLVKLREIQALMGGRRKEGV